MADRRSQRAVADFVAEAQEIIDAIGKELLRLEQHRGGGAAAAEPDPQIVNAVFRGAHSLKGLAAMFGVERMTGLAHALEDRLDRLRMGREPLDAATLDLLLEAPDLFARIIAEEASGSGPAGTAEAAGTLAARLRQGGAAPPPAPDALPRFDLGSDVLNVLTEYEEHRLRASLAKGTSLFRVRVSYDIATFDRGLTAVNAALKPLGEVIATLPSPEPGDPGIIAFELLFGSRAPLAEIREHAGPGAEVLEVPRRDSPDPFPGAAPPAPRAATPLPRSMPIGTSMLPAATSAADPTAGPSPASRLAAPPGGSLVPPAAGGESIRSASQAVRVDIHKLDRLMNAVGDLVAVKSSVLRLAERLRAGESAGALATELHRDGRSFERKLNELQAGILEVRMVPLAQVFDKLARMARKASREIGKEVELAVSGGEVELDKLIVEELSDPLMHLVRNAIDHGIEGAEERERLGKPRSGRIGIAASQKGNHVEIAVEDDGRGIDEQRLREVAVERGLATAASMRELARREVMNLIFVPGFSTAREVTALSGRGVGMDVVKNNITRLSGIIELETEQGRGTRFAITLPVTLAIVRALLVAVSGRTYAVPLNGVLEILAIDPADLRTVETREVVTLREQTLPLVRLSRLFRLTGDAPAPALAWPPAKLSVVVVGLAQERLGVVVDDVVGQQDVVVKPLGPALERVRGIAGATDLGSRRTILVLDVGAIVDEVLSREPVRDAV